MPSCPAASSAARGNGLWRYELADQTTPDSWSQQARDRLCAPPANAEWVEYQDQAVGRYRAARIEQGQLESCLFIGPDRHLPERDWLARLQRGPEAVDAVAFDLEVEGSAFLHAYGTAGEEAEVMLQHHRFDVLGLPETFYLQAASHRPSPGEVERARAWGHRIGSAVAAKHEGPVT